MTTKHTPGPWTLELVKKWPYGILVIGADGTEVVSQHAACHSTKQKSRADNEAGVGFPHAGKFTATDAAASIAAQDATARLIAAAPELLEALELAHDHLALGWENLNGEPNEKLCLIRAAIDKARGNT